MSSNCSSLSGFVKQSKKDKRMDAKKKKAEALLKLFEMNHGSVATNNDQPPAKRPCIKSSGDAQAPDSVNKVCSVHVPAEEVCAKAKVIQKARQQKAAESASRKNPQKYGPCISITLKNTLPFDKFDESEEGQKRLRERLPPLFTVDIQHLLLLALLKNFSFWTPRWCRLNRPRKLSSVVFVVLKDVSIVDFENHRDCFPCLGNSFLKCVEIVNPAQYNSSIEQDMYRVALSIAQIKRYTNREDVRQRVLQLITKPSRKSKYSQQQLEERCKNSAAVKIEEDTKVKKEVDGGAEENLSSAEDQFPRTSLLLATAQMMEEGYPLPVETNNKRFSEDKGYTFTKESYAPVTASSPMLALDCEMVHTGGSNFELTRVSIVNEKQEVVYDQLVKPYNEITNYLTQFSGMTKELLDPVTTRIEDVQRDIQNLLPPDAILCGQSLWNDLIVLKLFHPYVIDTAIIFNQSGEKKIRMGLRKLTHNFLGRLIQTSQKGHCSIEDAKAVMDLVKLKLSKNIEYGDAMLGGMYFPNITTYFQHPHKAENVEETFCSLAPSDSSCRVSKTVSMPGVLWAQNSVPKPETSHYKTSLCILETPNTQSLSVNKNELCTGDETMVQCALSVETSKEGDGQKMMCKLWDKTAGKNNESTLSRADFSANSDSFAHNEKPCRSRQGISSGKLETLHHEHESMYVNMGYDIEQNLKHRYVCQKEEIERDMGHSRSSNRRKEAFFKQDGSTVMFNIFEVLADNKVSAGLIGSQYLVSMFEHETKLRCEVTQGDADADRVCAKVAEMNREKDFTWVELHTLSHHYAAEARNSWNKDRKTTERKKAFLQIDEQVRKLVNGLQERTLVTVVMSGRLSDGCPENAATFLKTTW